MSKIYFKQAYLQFFMELAANNNKDWFDRHRAAFTSDVKEPFTKLVEDLIDELNQHESLKGLNAADCIFRIHKDVRFSKDKTPYKLQMSALITPGGRKQMSQPGLYLEIGPEFLNLYTGFYAPEKDALAAIRNTIAADLPGFRKVISHPDFIESFGEVRGEKNKRPAPGLSGLHTQEPLLLNKQFYLMHQADAGLILRPGLVRYILKHYKAAEGFNRFLSGQMN